MVGLCLVAGSTYPQAKFVMWLSLQEFVLTAEIWCLGAGGM